MERFGALGGIRIADFSWAWAGSYATTLLSHMGAEVIKIESSKRLDITRMPDYWKEQQTVNTTASFNTLNLNKMSITLDLTQPEAIDIAKRLIVISDVVMQNMRPGAMDKLGLGYPELKRIRSDIIMMSSSACGAEGPENQYIGFAPNFAAMAGISHLTGYADSPPATLRGPIDLRSATFACFAILAALNYRLMTGKGQHIDFSSREVISCSLGEAILDYTMNGRVQSRCGNKDDIMAPHNCYRCRGDGKWVSIAVSTEEEWQSLCQAIGSPAWAKESRFSDPVNRWQSQDELDKLLAEWTLERTDYEVMEQLQKVGVAAVVSMGSDELYNDRHLRERGAYIEIDTPEAGRRVELGPPWKLSATPPKVYRPAPMLGGHNNYVLGDLLGTHEDTIRMLEERQVLC